MEFKYALEIDGKYILLSDEGAEKQARELWKKTPQLKEQEIDEVLKLSEEVFLGLQIIKGDIEFGILIYKKNPALPSLSEITQALLHFALINQEEY